MYNDQECHSDQGNGAYGMGYIVLISERPTVSYMYLE